MEEFEDETLMISEVALIKHPDNIVLVVRILLHDVPQVLCLLVGKLVVHFCVSCNLHCKNWLAFKGVVSALNDLSKGPFTKNLDDLVPVAEMVSNLNLVVAFIVVKYWIALELTVACILSFQSLLVEVSDAPVKSLPNQRQLFL